MLLTLKTAARLLQVDEDRVEQWVQGKGLPARRVNERLQFHRVELLEWAWRHKQPISPNVGIDSSAPVASSTSTPILTPALELGGIHDNLPGVGKKEVYRALVDALPLPTSVDRDHLWQVVLARESLCPTGIGDGIAVPHPRNPIVLHVDQPFFSIGFPAVPIADFGAIDGKPVKTLLMIVSPTVRTHLRVLATLTAVLHSAEVVGCLDRRARPSELMAALDRAEAATSVGAPLHPTYRGAPDREPGRGMADARADPHRGRRALAWLAGGGRSGVRAVRIAQSLAILGMGVGITAAVVVLAGGRYRPIVFVTRQAWPLPLAALHLRLDFLAAFFLLVCLALAVVLVLAASGTTDGWTQGVFNLLIAALIVVILARNVVLLLVAWEVMALCGCVLMASGPAREGIASYLAATHIGTAFLLVLMPLIALTGAASLDLGQPLDLDHLDPKALTPSRSGLMFLLSVAGFGTKAGLAPFHPWVPRAYRTAPPLGAAVSSALMSTASLYLLLRTILDISVGDGDGPPAWWGLTLLGLGAFSGLMGIVGALGSNRIKVILGYSSVENVGMIAAGVGLGLLGLTDHTPVIIILGFGSALLHIINHAVLKTLWFLLVLEIERQTGTDDLGRLGGLLRNLPSLGTCAALAALGLAGMPGFGAFPSEWLLVRGLYRGVVQLTESNRLAVLAVLVILALVVGLASLVFCALFGLGFLGQARSEEAAQVRASAVPRLRRAVVVALAGVTIVLGVSPVAGIALVRPQVEAILARWDPVPLIDELARSFGPVRGLSVVAALLLTTVASLSWLRNRLLRANGGSEGRSVASGPVWDCGYGSPVPLPRVQYTYGSFRAPLGSMVSSLYPELEPASRLLPIGRTDPDLQADSGDLITVRLIRPLGRVLDRTCARLRWIQRGSIQLYLLFLLLTLVTMLIWQVLR